MKKSLIVFVVLISLLIGFLGGVLLLNRYSTEAIMRGLKIIKTDKLTGKMEVYQVGKGGGYFKIQEIK